MTDSNFWKHGQQAEVALQARISSQHLSDILHRRRGVSVERAQRLEKASRKVLGVRIPWEIWICNKQSNHPAFVGDPVNGEE